jgi:hypothetical protein
MENNEYTKALPKRRTFAYSNVGKKRLKQHIQLTYSNQPNPLSEKLLYPK